jgi:ribosomal-protein-alanine N-acetyltransferase
MLGLVSDFTLELGRSADAAAIAAMSRALIENGLEPSWPPERVLRHIRHAESVVLVARGEPSLLGFAIMQYADDTAHLNLLAVAPSQRRRGVARALVEWLEQTALTAGTFVIRLELRASNAAALAFYASLGYQLEDRVRGYYQGVEDAIRMRRDVRAGRGSERHGLSGELG